MQSFVYMDFKRDVQLLTSTRKRQLGKENVRPYFGSGMTHEAKKKTDSHFRGQEIQVLVAAESYEVGTHSPHVNNIFRVGCMSNLTVVVQEFGSMGRSGNNSDGFLLINEKDRRSAIGILDKTKKKKATLKHSLNRRAGGCTRSALGDVLDKSLSLILAKESWSYVVSTSVAQAVTSRTAETLTQKKHVASFFK